MDRKGLEPSVCWAHFGLSQRRHQWRPVKESLATLLAGVYAESTTFWSSTCSSANSFWSWAMAS